MMMAPHTTNYRVCLANKLNFENLIEKARVQIGDEAVAPLIISLPNTDADRTYDLDGLGNWKDATSPPVGGSATTERRDHNYMNQITRTIQGATKTSFAYDANATD
jgi:hypothetical protein